MKKKLAFVVAVGLCASILSLSAEAASLRPATEVDNVAIRLSDVFADVPKDTDADIAIAPTPGKSVTYDAHVLTQLAQRFRLDWKASGIADQCVLTRASVKIDTPQIEAAILDKIKSDSGIYKDKKIVVDFDAPNVAVYLPRNQPTGFVLSNFSYDERGKRFKTDIVAGSQESPVRATITGHVFVQRDIPVLSHRVEKGAVLSQSDLSFVSMETDRIPADALLSASDLIGQETATDIAEGLPLRARDVRAQRLVTRGSIVTMRIETPTMRVTAQGRALQDGAMGDTIRAVNTRSNRLIEGRVTAAGTVDVAITTMDQPMRNAQAEPTPYRQ